MTVRESIQEIIRLKGGKKTEAARELSVSVRTIDNWLKIEDPQKRKDRGLQLYLEGVARELSEATDHNRVAAPASESGLLPDPSPGSQ